MSEARLEARAAAFVAAAALVATVFASTETFGSPAMQIVSSAFTEGQPIPKPHTCEGADTSPAQV